MMKDKIKYSSPNNAQIVIALSRSAPIQIKPFPKIQQLCKYWKLRRYKTVVDIGCGRLRNSLFLVKHFKIWACDFPSLYKGLVMEKRLSKLKKNPNFMGLVHPSKLAKRYLKADVAVLAFVLHTLPDKHLRIKLIKNAIKNTAPPHEIFVAVPNGERYYRQRMQKKNKLNDGFFFDAGAGSHTFYREYSAREIDEFMQELGFKVTKIFPTDKKNQRIYELSV